jgi:hypothetical protein
MKTLVRPSPQLVRFLSLLAVTCTLPQRHHLLRVADALLTAPDRKTLTELTRQHLDAPDASNLADFFRTSPWSAQDLRLALARFALEDLFARLHPGDPKILWLSLDDCTAVEDQGCTALQAVAWTFDHSQHQHCQGAVHVALRVHVGQHSYPWTWRLYLRAKTVRRLDRQRTGADRLIYRSKYELAHQMLEEIRPLLPKGYRIYVLFDRWYASKQLLRFIRRQEWHVICALESNRVLSGQRSTAWNQQSKHQGYLRVEQPRADGRSRTYLVRQKWGNLRGLSGRVCVFISKRPRRDRHPMYFLSTDVTLTAQEVLSWYGKRWSQEVDFWYSKQRLGLGDYRVQSVEATERWYAVVYLTFVFLSWHSYEARCPGSPRRSLSDGIEQLRQAHACAVLQAACEEVLETHDVVGVLHRSIGVGPPQQPAG